MSSAEILKKVRYLEIRTKGLVNNLFGGEYLSAFKGRGMAFAEVRPYQYGDDIRLIDWNVTARTGDPHIKIFEEEREQTLIICVDISASGLFGSFTQRKRDLSTELAAVLAFSAIKNNDKVGLLLFTSQVEKFIPPRKGRLHVLRLIRELYTIKPQHKGTSISNALAYLNRITPRRSIITLISDMQDQGYEKDLKVLNKKHDLICLCVDDRLETSLPDSGLLPFTDPETGSSILVDTSNKRVRAAFGEKRTKERKELTTNLTKLRVDHVNLFTNESYIEKLSSMLQQRHNRY